jgi:hypothetical protein
MRLTPRMKKVMDHEYGQNKVEDDFSVGGFLYNGAKLFLYTGITYSVACFAGCFMRLMNCCIPLYKKPKKEYKYV